VHDQSLSPDKQVDGIAFESHSESRVLDVEEYGSTWVTEEYVRGQVAALGGGDWACVRLPRALADWQDVYVISPAPIPDPRPRRVPKGFVDQFEVLENGVRIAGWSTNLDAPCDRLEIRLDDEVVATLRDFGPRPDVAAWLGVPGAVHAGWDFVLPHGAIRSLRYQVATISAFSSSGEERILFLGTLESLNGHTARERGKALEHQLALRGHEIAAMSEQLANATVERQALEQQIAAMKQSRFWRARDRWFALKRAAGLTDEP
jgi:hypothetical protein